WPADEAGHTPATFPVGVLLTAERAGGAVRPRIVLGAVVGGVHNDGVVGDTQLIELGENLTDLLVMNDHPVAVGILAAPAEVLFCDVGPKVHRRGIVPEEEGLLCLGLFFHPFDGAVGDLLVDGFHALLSERTGVLDRLSALAVAQAVEDAAGP